MLPGRRADGRTAAPAGDPPEVGSLEHRDVGRRGGAGDDRRAAARSLPRSRDPRRGGLARATPRGRTRGSSTRSTARRTTPGHVAVGRVDRRSRDRWATVGRRDPRPAARRDVRRRARRRHDVPAERHHRHRQDADRHRPAERRSGGHPPARPADRADASALPWHAGHRLPVVRAGLRRGRQARRVRREGCNVCVGCRRGRVAVGRGRGSSDRLRRRAGQPRRRHHQHRRVEQADPRRPARRGQLEEGQPPLLNPPPQNPPPNSPSQKHSPPRQAP